MTKKLVLYLFGLNLMVLAFTASRPDGFFFLVVSDSHYGKSDRQKNIETINRMNGMEGADLPGFLSGK